MRVFKIAFTLSFFAFFCGVSQASYEPWPIVETEKAKYISEPSNRMESVRYIEPYDKNFLPYEICGEPSDFKITNLSMKLQYRFVNR
ncbi:MAG: hypothetical protein LBC85_08495, partial [Fibromonadaceae bacterium]|nr:hypothetical protein [Fibromonadaceae bacterium]